MCRPAFILASLIYVSLKASLHMIFGGHGYYIHLKNSLCMKQSFTTHKGNVGKPKKLSLKDSLPSLGQNRNQRSIFTFTDKNSTAFRNDRCFAGTFFLWEHSTFLQFLGWEGTHGQEWRSPAKWEASPASVTYYLSGLRSTMPITKTFLPGLIPPLMCPQNGTVWKRNAKIQNERSLI